MNNYIIDASVYAFQFANITKYCTDRKNILIEYAERIQDLYKIVIKIQPKHFKYFLSYCDIEYIRTNNLDLMQINMNSSIISSFEKDEQSLINKAQILLGEVIKRLKSASEYIEFEEWFKLYNVKYNSEPIINGNVLEDEEGCILKNTVDNISIIAALNNYIYNNDEKFKLIYFGNLFKDKVLITADFNINMLWCNELIDNNRIQYVYKIKNFPQNNNIQLNNRSVKLSSLDRLNNIYYKYSWNDSIDIFDNIFKHISLIKSECEISLEQYKKKLREKQKEILYLYIKKVKAKKNTKKEKENLGKIKKWKKQVMDIIYQNLKAIDDYLDVGSKSGKKEKYEHYNDCKPGCNYLLDCGANIRYFGADCVDEKKDHKIIEEVEDERTKNNRKFWLHIRPNNINCEDKFWYFSLRIHFRWVTNNKIEIGWIGRHLYLPCPKKNQDSGEIVNCNRLECPINPSSPLHDPTLSDYENFKKQWL